MLYGSLNLATLVHHATIAMVYQYLPVPIYTVVGLPVYTDFGCLQYFAFLIVM